MFVVSECSEGEFEDICPVLKLGQKGIDESTDTYDTLEWLSKNLKNYNQKAGAYGIFYPEFYSTTTLVNSYPILKAVSPQVSLTNWYLGVRNISERCVHVYNFYRSTKARTNHTG